VKILFVTCVYPPYKEDSGVAKLLTNLSAELIRKSHHVYVFSLMDDISFKKYAIINANVNGVETRFINVPMSSLTDFFSRYRTSDYFNPDINFVFKSYLSKIKPDIVHFHAIQGLGANMIAEAHNEGYPTILTMHDMWWFCPNLFMIDLNSNRCNQTKIITQQCIDCLRGLDGILLKFKPWLSGGNDFNIESFMVERDKYLKNILENYVDIILTNSRTLKESVKNNITHDIQVNENGVTKTSQIIEKPVNPHRIIFGFVGGKSVMKGYDILIDAFMSIKLSNWELHIYGVEDMGVMNLCKALILNVKNKTFWSHFLSFLKNKRKVSATSKNIKYFAKYSDLEKYTTLNTFDVVIVPSVVKESFSLITREGLLLKKPIICSDCGGPEEVIKNNVNGLIFKTNDVEDLKLKICAILKDPSMINKFKNNIDIQNITSLEEQVNELESIYRLYLRKEPCSI
jgi:glycosyltransferase involved in cell wall biosynthesis